MEKEMQRSFNRYQLFSLAILLMLAVFAYQTVTGRDSESSRAAESTISSYIVQATSADAAESAVMKVGGRVTAILKIINAVGAELSEDQIECLRAEAERIRIFVDGSLEVSGRKHGVPKMKRSRDSGEQPVSNSAPVAETHYPTLIGADDLHKRGNTGKGVTIAVLDTGLWKSLTTEFNADGRPRILAQYDATTSNGNNNDLDDWNGHGTHITSIMMSSGRSEAGGYQGIAPNARVVAVRAFEPDGSGTYLNVIKALDWIVSNRKKYRIRILNLSFGAPAASHYWDDPVNQAVMAAWQSGIIVVVAAGNGGPGAMTVGVPGNVPYVITVGAMTDNFTPEDRTDDRLATFSAAGPTFEGFVKPDLLAPGGHMLGQMPPYAWLPLEHPEFVQQINDYFTMSGTSQATAVVSGVLALMLQAEPKLKPDDAKCRVIASARAAVLNDGTHAYSIFQQGAGMVDAVAAVNESVAGCANRDLNIKKDLAGLRHYAGLAGVDDLGTYYLVDEYGQRMFGPAYEWSQGYLWPEGSLWPEKPISGQGALWNTGVLWDQASFLNSDSLLSQGALWPEGALWTRGLSEPVSTYLWANQE
jgi:serine protease AprX